jgi:very-short-patch-repair endonuclease
MSTQNKKPRIPWNKGLTKDTDERVRNYGETNKKNGKHSNYLKYIHWTEERKRKYGKIMKEYWQDPEFKNKTNTHRNIVMQTYEYHNNLSNAQKERLQDPILLNEFLERVKFAQSKPDYIEKVLEGQKGKILTSNTSIERIIQLTLKENGLNFESNVPLQIRGVNTIPDHANIKQKIAIYDDGDYWHKYPMGLPKDKFITQILEKDGWKVFRFWEHEILENPQNCVDKINHFLFANALA